MISLIIWILDFHFHFFKIKTKKKKKKDHNNYIRNYREIYNTRNYRAKNY